MPKIIDPERSERYKEVSAWVGSRIREARELRGMLGKDLCAQMERSTSWLSFVEQGVNGVNIMDLMLLSEILDYPIEFFLSDSDFTSSFRAPRNDIEWRLVYPGQPERAAAHASIDKVYRNAERVLRAQIKAGITGRKKEKPRASLLSKTLEEKVEDAVGVAEAKCEEAQIQEAVGV